MKSNTIEGMGREREGAAGLPGQPVICSRGQSDKVVPIRSLITDPKGNIILLSGPQSRAEHAAEALSEHFGHEIFVVHFISPERHAATMFAFTHIRSGVGRALTLQERAVVAAMVEYCANYRPGMRADRPVALPRILHDESAIADGYISDFIDEERAYMLADVCGEVFDLDAEVVDDANGWTVIISDEENDSIDAGLLTALQGACRLLQHYSIVPAPIDRRMEAPELRQVCHTRKTAKWTELHKTLEDIRSRIARIEATNASDGILAEL